MDTYKIEIEKLETTNESATNRSITENLGAYNIYQNAEMNPSKNLSPQKIILASLHGYGIL